jgi:AbrB family looped-hinge helix DNA binding protein
MMRRRSAMGDLSTTRMSSKGQVVIPEEVRKRLNLNTGSQFVVVADADKDVLILKTIYRPSLDDLDDLIAEARRKGREVGIKKADIDDAVRQARNRK